MSETVLSSTKIGTLDQWEWWLSCGHRLVMPNTIAPQTPYVCPFCHPKAKA